MNPTGRKSWLVNSGLVCASILLSGLIAEVGARVYRRLDPQPPNNRYSFRLEQPPPYRGAWYFSRQFIHEMFQQPNGWLVRPHTRLVVPGDFHGRYFNIDQGQRRTTGVPAGASHRVLVLGGSTVYAAEVPDSETIPSHLQRLLNARQPGRWRVENLGSIGLTTGQQLELLETLALQAGDVVVFYDGVNDVVQGVYNGDPHGWIVGENRKELRGAGPFKSLLVKVNAKYLASRLQDYSAFVGTVLGDLVNRQNLVMKHHLEEPGRVAALARETAQVFRANIENANRVASARGAVFVHFLQPQVFSDAPLTAYERQITRNYYISPNGLEKAFRAAYPLLRAAAAQLPGSHDLSQVLASRAPGEEFYLDFCHVNHAANARIAAAILQALVATSAFR